MKKYLFLIPVAALAMTACTNESDEFVGKQEAREIAFTPIAQPTTRAAVSGTAFPTADNFQVAAYMVEPVGQAGNYFEPTVFNYNATPSLWEGATKRYWPLSACYINFLGVANVTGTAKFGEQLDPEVASASKAVITQSDNSSAQTDLMYAIGNGEVTQSDNSLSFPTNVPMVFKHAQAWIKFNVKAANTASTAITVNSITLNGAKYAGTYTITHTNYNAKAEQSVAGTWSALGDAKPVAVPGWSATALTTADGGAYVGNGLLIVPDDTASDDFTSFTINYSYGGKTYDYTYTPASLNVEQAHSYTYNITFTLHEIQVAATVADWTNTNTAVAIP